MTARCEAARAALDLLLRHRAAQERPLRKVLKGLDRSLLPRVDDLGRDLAEAAVDALAAALEAVGAAGAYARSGVVFRWASSTGVEG